MAVTTASSSFYSIPTSSSTTSSFGRDVEADASNAALERERVRLQQHTENVHQMQAQGMLTDRFAQIRLREILEASHKRSRAIDLGREESKRDRAIRQVALEVQEHILGRRYPNTLESLDRERMCLRCHVVFRRRESLGRWQCWYAGLTFL